MVTAPNLAQFEWLIHGFGTRDAVYPPDVQTLKQIHSAIVAEAPAPPGSEADALIARSPGVTVGIRTADCVPVLLADSRTHAIAAIHAGWKGSAANIVSAAVRELITRYNSKSEDLHAAIGPAIGPCCYEVSPDVAYRFETWVPKSTYLDLARINELQLRALGVKDIWQARECTYCSPARYFSYRREKEQAGRMISFIGIPRHVKQRA